VSGFRQLILPGGSVWLATAVLLTKRTFRIGRRTLSAGFRGSSVQVLDTKSVGIESIHDRFLNGQAGADAELTMKRILQLVLLAVGTSVRTQHVDNAGSRFARRTVMIDRIVCVFAMESAASCWYWGAVCSAIRDNDLEPNPAKRATTQRWYAL